MRPSTVRVRQSEVPHAEQHWLCPTVAPSNSSRGSSPIQIRLDSIGFFAKVCLSMTTSFNSTSNPNGVNDFASSLYASATLSHVWPHRPQVVPDSSTSRCQRIARTVGGADLSLDLVFSTFTSAREGSFEQQLNATQQRPRENMATDFR